MHDLDLSRLGLSSQKLYLVYEFWSQRLLAEALGSVKLIFEPSSVNLMAIG